MSANTAGLRLTPVPYADRNQPLGAGLIRSVLNSNGVGTFLQQGNAQGLPEQVGGAGGGYAIVFTTDSGLNSASMLCGSVPVWGLPATHKIVRGEVFGSDNPDFVSEVLNVAGPVGISATADAANGSPEVVLFADGGDVHRFAPVNSDWITLTLHVTTV